MDAKIEIVPKVERRNTPCHSRMFLSGIYKQGPNEIPARLPAGRLGACPDHNTYKSGPRKAVAGMTRDYFWNVLIKVRAL